LNGSGGVRKKREESQCTFCVKLSGPAATIRKPGDHSTEEWKPGLGLGIPKTLKGKGEPEGKYMEDSRSNIRKRKNPLWRLRKTQRGPPHHGFLFRINLEGQFEFERV